MTKYLITKDSNIETMTEIRDIRNSLLQESDIWMISDYPLPDGVTTSDIETYRQSLRDFPSSITADQLVKLNIIEFPEKPF